jgi:hypothetical protein
LVLPFPIKTAIFGNFVSVMLSHGNTPTVYTFGNLTNPMSPIHTIQEYAAQTRHQSGNTNENLNNVSDNIIPATPVTDHYTTESQKIKHYADEYRKWGLCVIPPVKGEKRPNTEWKQYQHRFPTDAEWQNWHDVESIGIVCGTISGNLLVLDFDQQGKVFENFKQLIPDGLW